MEKYLEICPLCKKEVEDFEEHLMTDHFLRIQDYYEMGKGILQENTEKAPLTYINPTKYYLSDWNTLSNEYERKQYIKTVGLVIEDFLDHVISDRFLQMFIVSDFYFQNTPSHNYEDFKNIVKSLGQDRNKIWFIDFKKGYPKIISESNKLGIKVVLIEDRYPVLSEKDIIQIGPWTIKYPDFFPPDSHHQGRYSVLNPTSTVKETKRLKLKSFDEKCIKLVNHPNKVYSIFNVEGPEERSALDDMIIKMVLLRNKNFMRLTCASIKELIDASCVYSDSAFIKNTVLINPKKELNINFSWDSSRFRENFINISLI